MGGNKNRLYVALYPSGVTNNEERRYHWGFVVGPKDESAERVKGMKYHVKNNPLKVWEYEEELLRNVKNATNLLGRIMIAKVEDDDRLVGIFRETPVVQGDPNWRCRSWIKDALGNLAADPRAVGTSNLDWDKIEEVGRSYIGNKTAEGRYGTAAQLDDPKPTWDLLSQTEVFP